MSESSTDRLDKFQSKLNSKRTLFNVIVYVILPASLVFSFIYSILLSTANKIDYLLYITFVTIIYSLVVLLMNLLTTGKDLIGLRYIINKMGIDESYNTNISISIDDTKNKCDLSFDYPDRDNINKSFSDISSKTSKIINGEIKVNENDISEKLDKEFYNRCDSLENSDNLFKIKGTCLGNTSGDMATCSNLIKDATTSEEAFDKCNNIYSSTYMTYIVVVSVILLIVIADLILLFTGNKLVSDSLNIVSGLLLGTYTSFLYIKKPPCDYIDMNYPNVAVSPFPNYFLNSIMLGTLIKILSTSFKIFVLEAPEYTWLLIYIFVLSSVYVIKDYSFISVLEDSYGGFGKFINIMKLDRKTDKIIYNMSFIEKDTNKRCLINGNWDKINKPPNIKGDLEGCNSESLDMYLGNT